MHFNQTFRLTCKLQGLVQIFNFVWVQGRTLQDTKDFTFPLSITKNETILILSCPPVCSYATNELIHISIDSNENPQSTKTKDELKSYDYFYNYYICILLHLSKSRCDDKTTEKYSSTRGLVLGVHLPRQKCQKWLKKSMRRQHEFLASIQSYRHELKKIHDIMTSNDGTVKYVEDLCHWIKYCSIHCI